MHLDYISSTCIVSVAGFREEVTFSLLPAFDYWWLLPARYSVRKPVADFSSGV